MSRGKTDGATYALAGALIFLLVGLVLVLQGYFVQILWNWAVQDPEMNLLHGMGVAFLVNGILARLRGRGS